MADMRAAIEADRFNDSVAQFHADRQRVAWIDCTLACCLTAPVHSEAVSASIAPRARQTRLCNGHPPGRQTIQFTVGDLADQLDLRHHCPRGMAASQGNTF